MIAVSSGLFERRILARLLPSRARRVGEGSCREIPGSARK